GLKIANELLVLGDDLIKDVPAGQHSDHVLAVDHRQMADAPFTHDLPALFNRSVRRHRGDARGHDVADRCVARGPALQPTLASVIALRKDSDKPATFHHKHRTDVLLRENLERTLDCALRWDRKETSLLLHIEQLLCRFGWFVHHDSPSLR